MDKKRKKTPKTIPAANSFTNSDHSGWIFKHFPDGFMRKRWRKRYCVLSNGTLYLYEQQTSKGTDSGSASLDLGKYSDCVKASVKESKKSPNTFVLIPLTNNNNKTDGDKVKQEQVAKETFYADDAAGMETWISKLKQSMQLSCGATDKKLQHVTKSRARPPRSNGGNRRPPTKQHLKERARMSEITLDEAVDEVKKEKVPRGHIPAMALKPMGKPRLPNSTSATKETEVENSDSNSVLSPKSPPSTSMPASPAKKVSEVGKSKPPPPPVALKPRTESAKIKDESDGKVPNGNAALREQSDQSSADSDEDEKSTALKPLIKSTNGDEESSAEGKVSNPELPKKSKPPPPPANVKPRLGSSNADKNVEHEFKDVENFSKPKQSSSAEPSDHEPENSGDCKSDTEDSAPSVVSISHLLTSKSLTALQVHTTSQIISLPQKAQTL